MDAECARDAGVSLRCGHSSVRIGLSSADVLELCGPPTVAGPVQRDVRWVQQGDIWREFVVERMTWTYDRGPREFVRILHFKDDSLEAMELGGYGSR